MVQYYNAYDVVMNSVVTMLYAPLDAVEAVPLEVVHTLQDHVLVPDGVRRDRVLRDADGVRH